MTLAYMEAFDELISIAYNLKSANNNYVFPADTSLLFETVPGRQAGNAIRMKLGAPTQTLGDSFIEYDSDTWGLIDSRFAIEFDFRKEPSTTTGKILDGQIKTRFFSVNPGGMQLSFVAAGTKGAPTGGALGQLADVTESFRLQLQTGTNFTDVFTDFGAALPSGSLLYVNQWYHVKWYFDLTTSGNNQVTLKVYDKYGVEVVNFSSSGISLTDLAGTKNLFKIFMYPGLTIDNLYIGQSTASLTSTQRSILHARPTADGSQNDWAPTSGSDNFAMVDDADADNAGKLDSNLVSASGTQQVDLYSFETVAQAAPEVPASATIEGVQLKAYLTDPVAGSTQYSFKYRSGGSTGDFNAFSAGSFSLTPSGPGWESRARATDPFTGLAFTQSDFNAGEFGLELEP